MVVETVATHRAEVPGIMVVRADIPTAGKKREEKGLI